MSNFDRDNGRNPWDDEQDPWDAYAEQVAAQTAQERWTEWGQLGDEAPSRATTAAHRPHSGLGIASVILTVIAGMGIIAAVIAGVVLSLDNPALPDDDPRLMAVGCSAIGSSLVAIVGGVLGLMGLLQSGRNRLFAIVGCVLASLEVGSLTGLIIIGIMFG